MSCGSDAMVRKARVPARPTLVMVAMAVVPGNAKTLPF